MEEVLPILEKIILKGSEYFDIERILKDDGIEHKKFLLRNLFKLGLDSLETNEIATLLKNLKELKNHEQIEGIKRRV